MKFLNISLIMIVVSLFGVFASDVPALEKDPFKAQLEQKVSEDDSSTDEIETPVLEEDPFKEELEQKSESSSDVPALEEDPFKKELEQKVAQEEQKQEITPEVVVPIQEPETDYTWFVVIAILFVATTSLIVFFSKKE